MIRVALFLVLAGCFSRPSLSRSDAGSDGGGTDGAVCVPSQPSAQGMTFEENALHQWSANLPNGASVRFANVSEAYPFPIAMTVGDEQVLAEADDGCGREQVAGIFAYPFYSIHGKVPPTAPAELERVAVGGSYIEIRVGWEYQHALSCMAGMPHGNGHTTWSFFPDGRVVRNDFVQPVDNISVGQGSGENGCACIQNQFNIVTSYIAFQDTMVGSLTAYQDAEGATPLPTTVPVMDEVGACFKTPLGRRIGLRWDPVGAVTSRIRQAPSEYAFVYDLARSDTQPALDASDTWTLRTHMFLEPSTSGTCTEVNTKLLGHATMQPVLLGEDTIAVHDHGYFADTDPANGDALRARTGAVTLRAENGRLEAGFALRVRFPGYRSITTSVPSTWQHEDDDSFYIFFPDERAEDDEIVISPECPTE